MMRLSRFLPEGRQANYHEARRRSAIPFLSWRGRVIVFRELFLKGNQTRSQRLRVPLRVGSLCLDANELADWCTYDEIFVHRQYETEYHGGAVLDIGAHRGMFSAYALSQGANAVFAYEPDPKNFEFLKQTVASYQRERPRSEAHQKAVGSTNGTAEFHVYDESWSHSLVLRPDRKLVSTLAVAVTAFNEVVDHVKSGMRPGERLIAKIDAEGAEYDILLNSSPASLSAIDELFIELHGYATGEPNAILERLRQSGFAGLPEALPSGSHHVIHCRRQKR